MARVDFYLLAHSPVESVLPGIADKTLAAGERLLVVADNPALLDILDDKLWTHDPASFLPHARRGAGADDRQPILLSKTLDPANGARFVALADGRWREAALAFERVFFLFGRDRVEDARTVWRGLDARENVANRFWKQDEAGKWRPGP